MKRKGESKGREKEEAEKRKGIERKRKTDRSGGRIKQQCDK